MGALTLWQKHKKGLADRRAAFWEYIEYLGMVVESNSYLEEYRTVEEFIRDEASWSRQYFYDLLSQCQTRQRLSDISDTVPEKITHLKEISKVPESQQVEVFATTVERCESEGREPTAKDFRVTAKQIVESDPEREKSKPERDWKFHKAKAKSTAESLIREIDNVKRGNSSWNKQHAKALKLAQDCWEVLNG